MPLGCGGISMFVACSVVFLLDLQTKVIVSVDDVHELLQDIYVALAGELLSRIHTLQEGDDETAFFLVVAVEELKAIDDAFVQEVG